MSQYEEGQLVLATVDKIIGTTVFVKLEGSEEGTITTSEIAPGRIRNLRDYVVPNKKIVCKILSIRDNRLQLSLRRVKPNERKDLLEKIEKEKSFKAILKTILGPEEAINIIETITKEEPLLDFYEKLKENPKIIENYLKKEHAEKIIKIIELKKEKPKETKQIFKLSTKANNGIITIKNILNESCSDSNCIITYVAAGKYLLQLQGKDFKIINAKINDTLEKIEKLAKKNSCEFSVERN